MTEYREKEWDEPGPDFGKTIYVPRRPLMDRLADRICRTCEPEAQRRFALSEDRHMRVLEAIRWELHKEHGGF